jgi:hypothetical protein
METYEIEQQLKQAQAFAWGKVMTVEKQGQQKLNREIRDLINNRLGIVNKPEFINIQEAKQSYEESIRVPAFMVTK